MESPDPTIVIIEENSTRADLYELWLEDYTVRSASTRRQVDDVVDESVAVAVVAQEFADGAGAEVVDLVRARTPYCEVVTTSHDRRQVCPELDVDTHMTKPVFEEELRETVDRLAVQAVYGRALVDYYRLTLALTSTEISEPGRDEGPDRAALERRVSRLKRRIGAAGRRLDAEDRHQVLHTIVAERDLPDRDEPRHESKYVPDKCFECGTEWGGAAGDGTSRRYRRLSAFVWRCTECGRVQMQADPSHQQTVL